MNCLSEKVIPFFLHETAGAFHECNRSIFYIRCHVFTANRYNNSISFYVYKCEQEFFIFCKKKQYHKVSANNLLKLSNIADSLTKLWQNSSIFLKIQHFFSKLFNMAKFSIFFFFKALEVIVLIENMAHPRYM